MPLMRLGDISDARLRFYGGIRDPELLKNGGRFIAEGRLVVRRLLGTARFITESVLVTPAALAGVEDALAPHLPRLPVFVVASDDLVRLTGVNLHRGCLALGVRPAPASWRDVVPRAPARALVVALEGVANADNVGGAFRNAQAFGANAILMDHATTDPLYRKAIRTSMGASLVVPFARDDRWPAVIDALQSDAMTIVALTPRTDSIALEEVEPVLRATRRIAWLLGNEGAGLSAPVMAAADLRVRVPIATASDSLNASTALAIALYANTVAWRSAGLLPGVAGGIS